MFGIELKKKNKSVGAMKTVPDLLNSYLIVQVLLALEEIGVFNTLTDGGPVNVETLVTRKGRCKEKEMLIACLDFLWALTDMVEKRPGGIYVFRSGSYRFLSIMQAYKDVFDNMAELIMGRLHYGKDINRDGAHLQKASAHVTSEAIARVINSLAISENMQLVDLGCGAAQSIIYFCKNHPFRNAVGIDVDARVVIEARKNIEKAGIAGQAKIIEADVSDIRTWGGGLGGSEKKVFLASTLFHEFLRDGEEVLVAMLYDIGFMFPGARLFILEFDTPSFEELRVEYRVFKRNFFTRYKLWHPFTNQGMPQPQKEWERLIVRSGWKISKIFRNSLDLVTYDCFFSN